MTWTKLSDDFPEGCADLSDKAFRVHTEGLCWAMRRETGGYLSTRDIRRGIEAEDPQPAINELVRVGFWRPEGQGWQIEHHMEHQPEPEIIRQRRENDAERQRKKRRKQAGLDSGKGPASRRDNARDSHQDDPRDPDRDGTGRDGPGESTPSKEEPPGAARAREGEGSPTSPAPDGRINSATRRLRRSAGSQARGFATSRGLFVRDTGDYGGDDGDGRTEPGQLPPSSPANGTGTHGGTALRRNGSAAEAYRRAKNGE